MNDNGSFQSLAILVNTKLQRDLSVKHLQQATVPCIFIPHDQFVAQRRRFTG